MNETAATQPPASPLSRYGGMTRAGLCVMACAKVETAEIAALIDDGGLRWLVDTIRSLLSLKSDAERVQKIESILREGVGIAQSIATGERAVAEIEKFAREWLARVELSRTNNNERPAR